MNLSEHFALEDMVRSQMALRKGINNTPPEDVVENLGTLCTTLLEPARALWGVPVQIDSGYRCTALNAAVGGALMSAHVLGLAADCVPQGLDLQQAFDLVRKSDLPFDQMIFECHAWIHLALPHPGDAPRRQALTATGGPGAWRYQLLPPIPA